jgi:hypothetical protein
MLKMHGSSWQQKNFLLEEASSQSLYRRHLHAHYEMYVHHLPLLEMNK